MRKIRFLTLFIFLTPVIYAYNLRQLSNKDGLSNSAILSICQDNERFMWFGSCDGLNMYDGLHIQVYKPTSNSPNSLSGNLIEGIMEAENNILWIATNHGFNRLDKKRRTIDYYDEFQGKYHWAKTPDNEVFAIHEDEKIDYYDSSQKAFVQIPFEGIKNDKIRNFFIDASHCIWIFSGEKMMTISISFSGKSIPQLTLIERFEHKAPLLYVFKEKDIVYFIDQNYFLFELNTLTHKKILIANLEREIQENGIISTIIRDNDDYLIAFQTNGLFRLKNTPENEVKYRPERIDIYCGVFSLCKDELQDIVWIGTDGQGVYLYSRDSFSIRSVTFTDLPFHIQKPVRALFIDDFNTLWIGTKDDGIITIGNFRANEQFNPEKIRQYTTNNSSLTNNSVYAFAKSKRNLIWIGGDGPGLDYYSLKEKKIKRVPSESEQEIIYVHSICEVNDSTLWLATVGSGILKATLSGANDNPRIKSVERTMFIKDELSCNYFFSVYPENDSILWFGNRGYGLQRLNIHTNTFEPLSFYKENIKTINDILSIHKDRNGNMWFGGSYGITKLLRYARDSIGYENYNEIEGLPNNTIHGILEDDRKYLWLSTNNGIVQFHSETNVFRIYNQKNGLNVIEFSDGAYYRDEKTGILFFGGTNGFVTITPDVFTEKEFIPPVYFTGLKIYENEYNLAEFIKTKKNKVHLELKYDQNFFSISFIALDYINGQSGTYTYNLTNFNDKWIDKGHSNMVTFTKVPPGEYCLHIRYENGTNATSNAIYSLKIVILPPWYMTTKAYLLYAALIICILFAGIFQVRKQYKQKQETMFEKMDRQRKEEIYESKLRFFTNITHELCTPLTLIYGPCNRILSHAGANAFVKKYASLILKNAERLNVLIQELIEFRRIETGHKACIIENLAISELSKSITDCFSDLSETRNINYQIQIDEAIFWNSDKGCFTKILTNLVSNAFKYTPDNGKIEVNIGIEDRSLQLLISNTGKGIKEEDIPLVFDRYSVLENFEKRTEKGLSSRNGLGLAICYSMVKLLNGEITVKSILNTSTEFKVTLPPLKANPAKRKGNYEEASFNFPIVDNSKPVVEMDAYKFVKSRPTVWVIDDDPEMLWFVSEIFTERYNVIPVQNPEAVWKILFRIQPDLIICDIMMPQMDGITLMRQIKADKRTAPIPFILLSAKNTPEEQVEGIEAGAETYIPKPFNVEYLKSVVDRLLQRQDDLKNYYNSALSSFEFVEGKYIHKEDKIFFERIFKIIDENITNPDFSTELLASHLGLSVRHLYRKFEKVTDCTPADLIREYRLSIADKLLVSTQLSIDEIMYKAGFINRGSFYRIFSQKFGTTPKNYRIRKKEAMQ